MLGRFCDIKERIYSTYIPKFHKIICTRGVSLRRTHTFTLLNFIPYTSPYFIATSILSYITLSLPMPRSPTKSLGALGPAPAHSSIFYLLIILKDSREVKESRRRRRQRTSTDKLVRVSLFECQSVVHLTEKRRSTPYNKSRRIRGSLRTLRSEYHTTRQTATNSSELTPQPSMTEGKKFFGIIFLHSYAFHGPLECP